MLNSKKIDPAKSFTFDWRKSTSASQAAAWVLSMSNEELSVSWPIIFSALVLTNSAIEAPYQNRNDAAFGLTAGSANSITRSIAERRSDCARRGDRESDARFRRLEWKSGFREADSNFCRCGSRVVADHSHPTCILASR